MSFTGLTPLQLLILGGAVSVGVVLLYLLKLRRRRVQVPFVALWDGLTQERVSSALFRRLRRWVSLLIQLAIAAFMVFALGDPRPTSVGGGCGYGGLVAQDPHHLVLVMDTSASMGALEDGQTRLERAARQAHRLIEQVSPDPAQRIMVISSDVSVRSHTLWSRKPQVAHDAIDEILARGPIDASTSTSGLLEHLAQTLEGRDGARAVWITDGAFEPLPPEPLGEIPLHVNVVGRASGNVGIEGLNVRPHLDDSMRYGVYCAVRNETDHALEATVLLYANERGLAPEDFIRAANVVSSFPLRLAPRTVTSHLLEEVSFGGSRLAARVILPPGAAVSDRLPADDVAVALVPPRRRLRVQLVSQENLFVQAALLLRKNVDFQVIAPEDYKGPEGYDLTILDRVDVDLSTPGDFLLFHPPPSELFKVKETVKEPQVRRVSKEHPVGRGLSLVDLGIEEATRYVRQRGDQLVVEGSGGL
ncbi:MAG: VWA domain-containing protein, partial [Myxococcota bacterium]|nr:VWA domain-containing protein [Myxococcota bacterium]